MEFPYPDYDTYRALYTRYDHPVSTRRLLNTLEVSVGQSLLDLCGGDGRLTIKAVQAGVARVTLVDETPTMVPLSVSQLPGVTVLYQDVASALPLLFSQSELFDRVVCQQAINYWLSAETAAAVAAVMRPGGIFAFNTFNTRPSEKPVIKDYEYGGHQFVEVSWLIDSLVHHIQIRAGLPPHQTVFSWLSPERLRALLDPHFHVSESTMLTSTVYRCQRR